jgi:hypothetical protein
MRLDTHSKQQLHFPGNSRSPVTSLDDEVASVTNRLLMPRKFSQSAGKTIASFQNEAGFGYGNLTSITATKSATVMPFRKPASN